MDGWTKACAYECSYALMHLYVGGRASHRRVVCPGKANRVMTCERANACKVRMFKKLCTSSTLPGRSRPPECQTSISDHHEHSFCAPQ
ncbi:hypothetical protein POVWA2_018990 [Plasmodium ovale wallikeri]|uniref:Uncharacterized protein n=1 Tax=Plasmodium ovale wallikeri TaxID=864142 RepID=A0A1A8YRW9_PLAOA|nr:hypothetical protein POVWA2_018990 [Plasmodium ovale wallikeri]